MDTDARVSPCDLGSGCQHTILDVRTSLEYRGVSLGIPHVHIPLDQLDIPVFAAEHGVSKEKPLYLLCHSGNRAEVLRKRFIEAGYTEVHVIEGGLLACMNQGLEVRRGSGNFISLERQVRIVAGLLILLGVSLGAFVSGLFYGVAAFVGAGLFFAGVTDWCGLGLLLARAPWNR